MIGALRANCVRSYILEIIIYAVYLTSVIYGGSYMSAHVLLNLLNELGKRDKMRGLPSILSFFFSQQV